MGNKFWYNPQAAEEIKLGEPFVYMSYSNRIFPVKIGFLNEKQINHLRKHPKSAMLQYVYVLRHRESKFKFAMRTFFNQRGEL